MRIYSIAYQNEEQLEMQLFDVEISWSSRPKSRLGSAPSSAIESGRL